MTDLNPLFAFAAGALTILSPCVLPLVPIVIGSAADRHRWGPLALAGGLVLSFTITGFGIALLGQSIGLDGDAVRRVGAVLMIALGLVMLSGQSLLTRLAGPAAAWAADRQRGLERHGLLGQALIGVLLGIVWSPCVGPTLGTATVLAGQGRSLATAALVMAAFGLGIASVLLVIGMASRAALARWRGRMMAAGRGGRRILALLLLLVGAAILFGLDRAAEAWFVAISPDWLIDWSTRF